MGRLKEIVFDCDYPAKLARFWAPLLDGYAIRPYDDAEIARLAGLGFTPETDPSVMVDGPGPTFCFQRVEGRRHDANRIHLDIKTGDRAQMAAAALRSGGTLVRETPTYTVLADPEGNRFCVVS